MPSEDTLPVLFEGTLPLWIGFLSALVAVAAYFVASRRALAVERVPAGKGRGKAPALAPGEVDPVLIVARTAFVLMAVMAFLAAGYLMYLILSHRFDVYYVIKVSARRQLPFYLFASFWGDQQGSFFLWLLHTSIIGLILMKVARKYEPQVMTFISMLPACIFWILILKSPFKVMARPWPDGQGMSPLLENPWMTIHPPILFLGFALTTVLYAYAMAGMWRRDYDGWAKRVMPWACLGFAVLGCGVCMGGYWAYSTLGWGGFWGWDPVENSSLFPWIGCTMLMHALVVQRTRGAWHRTTALLATVPFVFVLYSTFLTRSGVLSQFSNHTFGNIGIMGWLLGGIIAFALLGLAMFAARYKDFPRKPAQDEGYTLETAVYWGVLLLGVFGAVVIVATSWPVISGWASSLRERMPSLAFLPSKAFSFQADWYNRMTTPLGILMALAAGSITLVRWAPTGAADAWRKARGPLAFALALGLVVWLGGWRKPFPLLLLITGAWTLGANARMPLRKPASLGKFGSYVAHAGLGLMLIGIVGSSVYDSKQRVTLVQGQPQKALGYDVELVGVVREAGRLKQLADIRLRRGSEEFDAKPTVHLHTALGRDSQWITWPYIKKYWDRDIYVAPIEGLGTTDDLVARSGEVPTGRLVKDQGYTIFVDTHPAMVSRGSATAEMAFRVTVQGAQGTDLLTPTVKTDMATFAMSPGKAAVTRDG
ncbi:MAG TPA: cytochrome c biogenesis protein CcsA, partial [Armatimonadota bacterium]